YPYAKAYMYLTSQTQLPMTPESSVDSNTADHGNNVAPTPSHYNDLSWNNIRGAYGPTADGVGLFRSWIWKHGWKVESLVDKKL
ncbi:hypothetical protein E4U22_003098, partial [Claviceps purpurea]